MNKHYNETELNEQLKSYLSVRLKENQSALDKEIKKLGLPKLLPNLKEVVEQNIEVFTHRLNFYQTQLNNLKGKTYTPTNADDYESGVEEVIEYK